MYPNPYDTIPHGSVVVCTYRMPSVIQPWIHPIRLGVVERADMDAATWNGKNDEQSYCTLTGKVRVNWGGCVQHDKVEDLIILSQAEIDMSDDERILRFLGAVAYRNLLKSRGCPA